MQAIERRHHMSPETPFDGVQHYVLTFHDSTIEALAGALLVVGAYQSPTDAIANLMGQLGS